MSAKTKARRLPVQRSRNMQDRRRKAPQMDLFASGQSGGLIGPPDWPELLAEVQDTLTSLMAQLILEHADKSRTAVMMEAGHDL
ncbi:hypothetical protein [Bradyrhizobium sp. Ash2021]|uniref:hypothetical protein n=1 Tax=Bradyrhizobium sp. Ash2021 TaxID=2954771 RepID=UPI0028151B30|nr:hypothetical protein [Bradyrhizobium sp. Ash2021]WMT76517.1 hypothetical protein NL528_09200 [Bradyrhizobium sp. Ash2021]